MTRDLILAGLDVGTTKIALVLGEVSEDEKKINIIAQATSPAEGIKKGVVVNLDETAASIDRVLEKVESMTKYEVHNAFVGIAGEHIASLNSQGVIAVTEPKGEITEEHLDRVKEAAKAIPLGADREILHVIPRDYIVDGQDGIRNPLGMAGMRLEIKTHIVTGSSTFIKNLTRCCERVAVAIDGLVLQPIASGKSVLFVDEKELGVVLVDIGGGTTDIAIFYKGTVAYTTSISVGGNHLDRDIAAGLNIPIKEAEELKIKYGSLDLDDETLDERFEITNMAGNKKFSVPKKVLTEIIQARVEEIFAMILQKLQESGFDQEIPAGIVLTGGCSLIKGIDIFAQEFFELPVRIGIPSGFGGLTDEVKSPVFATSVGLLLYGLENITYHQETSQILKGIGFFANIFDKIKEIFKNYI